MRLNTLALAFSLLSLALTAASAADLSITVKDVHNSTGTVYLAVYDESSFGKPQLAKVKQKAPAAKGDITFVVHDLPAGRYAVSSYQDENGNGKLDTISLGVPTEAAEADAEGLEHHVSETTLKAFAQFLKSRG